jgi:hypothetical protein
VVVDRDAEEEALLMVGDVDWKGSWLTDKRKKTRRAGERGRQEEVGDRDGKKGLVENDVGREEKGEGDEEEAADDGERRGPEEVGDRDGMKGGKR